ncbi:hypothetical protein GCM10027341_15370 [Spirosoma knui]
MVSALLLVGLLCSSASAQQINTLPFEFRHIGEAQGLSFKLVTCMLRDRDGFLWVGTANGLNRFDGDHFTAFRHERRRSWSIGSSSVNAIGQDKSGRLWVATGVGISRYDARTGHFENIRQVNGITLGHCSTLLGDRQGRIWFSSQGKGLFCYDPRTNRYRQYTQQDVDKTSLSDNSINRHGLIEDPKRPGLWVATYNGGMNYFDMTTGRFVNVNNVGDRAKADLLWSKHSISALTLLGSHRLAWADNTVGQIVIYDLNQQRIERTIRPPKSASAPLFPIATLFADHQQNIWVSSWNNLLYWVEAGSDRLQPFYHDPANPSSVAGPFFWCGWQQDDGTIWLGTVNGLSLTNPSRSFYRVHNLGGRIPGLNASRGLNSIIEDRDGSWWLSSATHELIHYHPATGRSHLYHIPSAYEQENGFGRPSLTFAPDGRTIYIHLDHALLQFDKQTGRFASFIATAVVREQLSEVSTLLVRGDTLWLFGWHRNRAIRYSVSTGRWQSYALPCPPGDVGQFFVRTAAYNRRGELWLDVYPGGFVRFDEQTGHFRQVPVHQPPELETTFFYFKTDAAGRIWLPAAENGLVRYDPRQNTLRQWTHEDGLSANKCMAVCPDRNGRIWVASLNNFFVFDSTLRHIQQFSLPINQTDAHYENYMVPLRNGHILMTVKGYVLELMPERFNAPRPPSRLLISDVRLPDTTMMTPTRHPTVQLRVDQNDFAVRYGILNQAQQPYSFFYKLEGYDEDWVEAGSRTVGVYANVPGGRYVFRVQARTDNNRVFPAQLVITIDTVFYKTGWFRVLLIMLIAGLMFGVYRYRLWQAAQLHQLHMQATQLERDKTRIQYQNLINHLNPHFLFNSLTSLNSLIITAPDMASDFLQKLATIYRYILQNKERETVTLEHELNFVSNYVDLQQARFEEGLQIDVDIPLSSMACRIVPVTLQNLFENAIKHNVIEDDRPLTIRVYVQDDYLFVANNLQRKNFVETSNQQGLDSLKTLYGYLSDRPLLTGADDHHFVVKVPLL